MKRNLEGMSRTAESHWAGSSLPVPFLEAVLGSAMNGHVEG
jgi:hypothetical protein